MRCHEAGGEQGITMATTISTQGERAAFIAGARAAFDSAFVQLDDPGYLVMRSWIDHDLRDWTRGEPPECPELDRKYGERALAALEVRHALRQRSSLVMLTGVVGFAMVLLGVIAYMAR